MDALIPLDANSLSDEEKKKAIALLMFLTEKQDVSIKAWQCADRHKQQEYMEKDESMSPTVSVKAIFLTTAIEAKKRRKVAVVDLLGAFLHAVNDDDVIMFMQGRLAELMAMVVPHTGNSFLLKNDRKYYMLSAQGIVWDA